jgi:hypothetical protein
MTLSPVRHQWTLATSLGPNFQRNAHRKETNEQPTRTDLVLARATMGRYTHRQNPAARIVLAIRDHVTQLGYPVDCCER